MAQYVSATEAVSHISSNQTLFIHSAAAAPQALIKELVRQSDTLQNVTIYQMHTEGAAPYAQQEYKGHFKVHAFFMGENLRKGSFGDMVDYIPVFLSEIPALFRKKILPLNVALIQVSPPDNHQYCSLGPSVDISLAAVQSADLVIAQVNPHMPRTHGCGQIHLSEIDYLVENDDPLLEGRCPEATAEELAIGRHVAAMIEDGSTLQMGIGAIPNAVLKALTNHRDLGIHTEMFSDGVIDLVERGVVTGRHKVKHPGKIVTGFVLGSNKLYEFIDENPSVLLLESSYTNDTHVIRQNPKVAAINSAIEVDLTGQICADSIGGRIYSGVGGQMDFIRGATLSQGGKPIIALRSTTSKGDSKIVPYLKQGAGVVTTRAHAHYVVTEFGVADLYGKTTGQRAQALIAIAHPQHRESLERIYRSKL